VNHRIIAALVPHARLHIIRGGGHLVLLDSAPEVAPVIARFLRGDRPAPGAPGDLRAVS
jgi:pimeloyl-ACP methyl ester carboxylesterase